MDVVVINTDLKKMEFVAFLQFQTYLLDGWFIFRSENLSSVFYGTDEMVYQFGDVMRLFEYG